MEISDRHGLAMISLHQSYVMMVSTVAEDALITMKGIQIVIQHLMRNDRDLNPKR